MGSSISRWPLAFFAFLGLATDAPLGSPEMLLFSASIRSTTLSPRGRGGALIAWPPRFLLMRSVSGAS